VPLIDRRIGFLFAGFLVLLALGFVRAGWLGVVRAPKLADAAASQQKATLTIPARRGTITDRDGTELAVSRPAVTITATPYLVEDPVDASAKLAPLLRVPEDELLRTLSRRDTGFVYLARKIPVNRAERVKQLGIAGIDHVEEFDRVYPRDWTASQVLGTVGYEGKGLMGLEYSLDKVLHGQDGSRYMVKDALGDPIELRDPTPTLPGSTVRLTLDAAIQDRAETVLADVGRAWKPKGATAVVMDPRDGSILALANWPQVDANDPHAAPDYAQQNRAVAATYEPGSTFKAFTVASAIEDDRITPDTPFNLPPTYQVADREIRESHDRGAVTWSVREILEHSSNVGAVMIGQLQGKARFHRWLERFGFGQPTGVDMPGEERGIMLPLEKYSDSTIGNLPLGQGIAVTPMQMAAGYAAIANGGVLRPPHIVDSIDGRKTPVPEGRRVISEQTSRQVSEMLEGVLGPGGTASGAAIDGYVLAGKTGTAQKPDPIYGGYSKTKYVASFVGYAPAAAPKLLVSVMVDEPQGDIYGGTIAAPAWRRITSFALTYLRIAPD
jgi:cell division protein FtsI/penicillin-binding protein 2